MPHEYINFFFGPLVMLLHFVGWQIDRYTSIVTLDRLLANGQISLRFSVTFFFIVDKLEITKNKGWSRARIFKFWSFFF